MLAKQIEADLVVMGAVARTGVPGFIMGNTAETILNRIDCSVPAIKLAGVQNTGYAGELKACEAKVTCQPLSAGRH